MSANDGENTGFPSDVVSQDESPYEDILMNKCERYNMNSNNPEIELVNI